jgi:hypothetical protein
MPFVVVQHRFQLALIALAVSVCAIGGCGGPSRDIVDKWRTSGDANAMVWEFFPNGSVLIGSDKGRYSFGDQNRIKIQTPFGTSIYQMELSGDHLTLKPPNGSKLELTRIKESKN